jgi:hypothetical protein
MRFASAAITSNGSPRNTRASRSPEDIKFAARKAAQRAFELEHFER